jgi:tryptophan synthase alpha chain
MSRLTARFGALREAGRKALIPYLTAGDPEEGFTVPTLHALVAAGADALELGVPFSDPMADGPVIQRASERALAAGIHLDDVLAMVADFRRRDPETPIILMGYMNPIEARGYGAFAEAAGGAGVDGIITVDLPPEEAAEPAAAFRANGLDPVFLVAPTSTEERIARIGREAGGFVYYVSLKGVTGSDRLDVDAVAERVAAVRRHTGLPIGVGFGISDPESAARVSRVSDAVVVGSAIVRQVESHPGDPEAARAAMVDLVAGMRRAMDAAG